MTVKIFTMLFLLFIFSCCSHTELKYFENKICDTVLKKEDGFIKNIYITSNCFFKTYKRWPKDKLELANYIKENGLDNIFDYKSVEIIDVNVTKDNSMKIKYEMKNEKGNISGDLKLDIPDLAK